MGIAAYGKRCSGEYESQGGIVHFKSKAEMWRADVLEACWKAGLVVAWAYETHTHLLEYKYKGQTKGTSYTPDFVVGWQKDGLVYEEVKRGFLDQKYANRMKRFLEQCPDAKLRLIWYGSEPKRGKAKANLDKVRPYLFDLQFERPPQ